MKGTDLRLINSVFLVGLTFLFISLINNSLEKYKLLMLVVYLIIIIIKDFILHKLNFDFKTSFKNIIKLDLILGILSIVYFIYK